MTIIQQIGALRDALSEFAEEIGAELAIVADNTDANKRIANNSTGCSILLALTSEEADPSFSETAVVWRKYVVIMARPHSWTVKRGESLTETAPDGAAAFYDDLEQLRDHILNAELSDDRTWNPEYLSGQRLDNGEEEMDVWELEFKCGTRLAE